MSLPKVQIKGTAAFTELYIDGQRIEGVRGISYTHNMKENEGLPVLSLDLMCDEVCVDTYVLPELPETYARYYERRRGDIRSEVTIPSPYRDSIA